MKDIFINEAFDYAFIMYKKFKQRPYSSAFNGFLVVVIRQLFTIYDNEDGSNLLKIFDEKDEAKFNLMLRKYGYKEKQVEDFKAHMLNFYNYAKSDKEEKNIDFVLVQKDLIDMMICRLKHEKVLQSVINKFAKLLYSPDNLNPSYKLLNEQLAEDPLEVKVYWMREMFKKDHKYELVEEKKDILNPKIYETMGFSLEDVLKMPQSKIDSLNTDAFARFSVDINATDKYDRLTEAVNNILNKQKTVLTGSGFVDILLISSILATLASVGFIFSLFFLR